MSDPLGRPTDASDGKPGRLSEADLIPGSVKSTMIMEAAQDIRALERDLRLVESYRDRDAAGAGDLEGMCLPAVGTRCKGSQADE